MAESSFYGLQKIQTEDNLTTNDYSFGVFNIDVIDRLLAKINDNIFDPTSPIVSPTSGLSLTTSSSNGSFAAGRTLHYKFTYVDPYGNETAASPETVIETASGASAPLAPTISSAGTGGTITLGRYFYTLSSYVIADTNESIATNRSYVVLSNGVTNTITLTLPSVPAGASGFNVFKKGPGQSLYYYVTSIDMTVVSPPTEWVDDGSWGYNATRNPVSTSTSNSTNSVTVTVPNGVVPNGYTWKIYRSYSNNFDSSLLAWVTAEASPGVVVPSYMDTGNATSIGHPPSRNMILGDLVPGLGATPEGMVWLTQFFEDFARSTPTEDLTMFDSVVESDPNSVVETVFDPGNGYWSSDEYLRVARTTTDLAYVEKLYPVLDGETAAYGFAFKMTDFTLTYNERITIWSVNNALSKATPGPYDAIEFAIVNSQQQGQDFYWPCLLMYIDGALDQTWVGTVPISVGSWTNVRVEVDWQDPLAFDATAEPDCIRLYVQGAFVSGATAPHFDTTQLDASWWGMVRDDDNTDSEVLFDNLYIESRTATVRLDPTTATWRRLQADIDPLPTQYGRRQQGQWLTDNPGANQDRVTTVFYDDPQFSQIRQMQGSQIYKLEGFLLIEAADNEDIKFKITPLNSFTSLPVRTRYIINPGGDVVGGALGKVYEEDQVVVLNAGGLAYTVGYHFIGLIDCNSESEPVDFHFHWAQNATSATPGGTSILAGSWFRVTK